MSEKIVKSVFYIVGMCLVAMLLYQVFFVGDNSAIRTACNAVETPIARDYYRDILYPSIHRNEGVDSALGISITSEQTDLTDDIDNSNEVAEYSTGWR